MEPKIGEIEPDVIWLHFDAKYRVNKVDEIFGPDIIEIEKNERRSDNKYKNPDLLIMHAYKDAVKHSEGAYIIFPGSGVKDFIFPRYDEILPSIGAFPLLPDELETQTGITFS